MKEEFDLVVEVTITYLRTIQYELDDYDYEVATKKHKNPLLPSIKLTKRK